jgi:predicted RNA-binding Zn-ribbon protein involved in translation (DUF1610 family)
MVERGCPNCGSLDYMLLDVNSLDTASHLRVIPKLGPNIRVSPYVCLQCGSIYLTSSTLNELKEREKRYEKN